MSANLNRVFLMGNLTRDPEMRQLPSGSAVCSFGLAVNRRFVNSAGATQEEVCFVDISAFGRTGEVIAQYLRKGSPVFIEGRLRFEQWEERETNKKRSRLSVVAERIEFIGSRQSRDGSYAEDDQAAAASAPGGWQQQRPPMGAYGGPQAQAGPGEQPPPAWRPAAPQQQAPYQNAGQPPAARPAWQPQATPPPQAPPPQPMPTFEPLPDEDSNPGDDLPF